MNNKILVSVGIAAVGVIVYLVSMGQLGGDLTDNDIVPADLDSDVDDGWNRVGFFGVNKDTYKLGENVFFAGRLSPDQQVLVRVASPEGTIFQERVFNGADRELIKFYFKPDTSAYNGLYEKDQLVGTWLIWFEGLHNDDIRFEIIDEFIPGAEDDIVDIPRPAGSEDDASVDGMNTGMDDTSMDDTNIDGTIADGAGMDDTNMDDTDTSSTGMDGTIADGAGGLGNDTGPP